jgi:4-amino-4-deoxy-L-arabinose transferase-like glycosyltransferase
MTPEAGVVLACLIFIAISAWWLASDLRIVNLDTGKHIRIATDWYGALQDGRVLEPLLGFADYPPGPHLVGAAAGLIFGPTVFGMILSHNLLFVPLLALGCYGTGRIVFGRKAGALAALFALAAPLVMAVFHMFLPDGPMTAMVALTVWLLLASERFERIDLAIAAGVAAGLGMYTKGTFVFFIAGVIAMMLLRGGWRNWRGVVAFGVVAWAICGPWFFAHYYQLRSQTGGAVGAARPTWYGSVPYPERWSPENFTWYGWNLVNNQLYLPLFLFFVIGLVWAVRELVRRRASDSHVPELLAGGFIGYFATSLLVLKDPRYSLPCLVFVAVIATGWITALPRRGQLIAAGVLVAVFVFNTVQHNFDVGGQHKVSLPGAVASPIGEYTLTLVNDRGYSVGPPDRDAEPVLDLLERLHDDGVRNTIFDANTLRGGGYNLDGLRILARKAKLATPGFTPEFVKSRQDAWITRAAVDDVDRPPCLVSPLAPDGSGLYVYRGRVPKRMAEARTDCP